MPGKHSETKIISRREARERLLSLIFAFLFLGEREGVLYHEMTEDEAISSENKEFIKLIYAGVCENIDQFTQLIYKNVKDFSASQIFKCDMAILLIGVYEILFQKTSPAIAINEAVNLAKKFSTDKSSSFVNGVLSSVVKGMGEEK